MNLYIRYFNDEIIVPTIEDAVDFLNSLGIDDFEADESFLNDLQEYIDSPDTFPKRYKIHSHNYFIVIKTEVNTLEEFKMHSNRMDASEDDENPYLQPKKIIKMSALNDEVPGWYDGTLNFKRVIAIPGTNKFQYQDTRFRAYLKARSPLDCYNRIVEYLRNRQDVDLRSQFPSAKGRNFTFSYLGTTRPKIEG